MTPSTETSPAPVGDDRLHLLERLLADTRLDAASAGAPRPPVPAELRRAPENGPLIALPPPATPRAALADVLPERSCTRDYAATPLSGADLSSIFAAADLMDARGWPDERAAGVDLELYCAAWRVSGVDI